MATPKKHIPVLATLVALLAGAPAVMADDRDGREDIDVKLRHVELRVHDGVRKNKNCDYDLSNRDFTLKWWETEKKIFEVEKSCDSQTKVRYIVRAERTDNTVENHDHPRVRFVVESQLKTRKNKRRKWLNEPWSTLRKTVRPPVSGETREFKTAPMHDHSRRLWNDGSYGRLKFDVTAREAG